jgi:hypothetical protein
MADLDTKLPSMKTFISPARKVYRSESLMMLALRYACVECFGVRTYVNLAFKPMILIVTCRVVSRRSLSARV